MAMLHQARRALAFTIGLAAACGAHAQALYPNTENFGRAADPQAPWYKECMRVAKVQPAPVPALPASCKAYDYYGKLAQAATSPAEWGGVRACAVAAKDNAVLAMLYANGLGVPRDLDLATHYACRAGGAQAEVTGRIEHLMALRKSPAATRFDQCDDITSGAMGGVCAGVADGQADKVRLAYFARLRRQLLPAQTGAFDKLVAATNAFASARGNETDLSGTARGAMVIHAEAREKEWLREHLAAFEKGGATVPLPATFAAADADLNRAYKTLLALPPTDKDTPDRLPYSTVTRTDVRAAQRAWLVYRDTWLAFAALRYPAIAPDALKSLLTDWRTKQLERMGGLP
jgi:uncharacterized protein YecT (DUF1311 family)